MSQPYRIEREPMPAGTSPELQTYRVLVRLGKRWGTVQTGLDKGPAEDLCVRLNANELDKRTQHQVTRSTYRR